jgi:hypothetical protein
MHNAGLLTDDMALIGVIDADAYTAAAYLTAAIDMSVWERIAVLVAPGDLGTNATLDAKVTESATSGGSYTDISGKAITQMTQAGTDMSNKQRWINVRGDELTDGMRYVKVSMTVATATSDAALYVFGYPRYLPAQDVDLSSVTEIIS